METVTVSPKYQVVIPSAIRRSLDIRPGQKVQMIRYEDRVELSLAKNRGSVHSHATTGATWLKTNISAIGMAMGWIS